MGGWENWVSKLVVSNRTSKTWSNYPFLRSKFMWLSEALLERTATKVFQFTFTFMLYVLLRSPGSWVCWWWWHSITPHHIGNPKHGTVTNGPLLTKAENIHLSCLFKDNKIENLLGPLYPVMQFPSFPSCSPIVLQCYHVAVLQCCSANMLQCYSTTVLQCYWLKCYCVTVLMCCCCVWYAQISVYVHLIYEYYRQSHY